MARRQGNASTVVWKSVLIECYPGLEDMISTLVFDAGFSGINESFVDGRTRYTVFYSFPSDPDPLNILEHSLFKLAADSGTAPARILAVDELPDTDWEEKWREGLGAVITGRSLVVRPSWVEYDNVEKRIEIIINPKMAFGTGGHATTALCLEALEHLDPAGKTMIDAGCGSGVLSIAAAKLGAVRVFGFDNDPFSVENAEENIGINGVQDRVTVEEGNLEQERPEPSDIVLANLISRALIENLHILKAFLRPGGVIVFSGLLATEEELFSKHLCSGGFRIRSTEHRDEWIAVTAELV